MLKAMRAVTQILSAIEQGDPQAADDLLPLVYEELRCLAAARLAQEKPGHTLPPTALVHEAYVRLVAQKPGARWDGRGHFLLLPRRRCVAFSSNLPVVRPHSNTATTTIEWNWPLSMRLSKHQLVW
jgi:hypothetical protein